MHFVLNFWWVGLYFVEFGCILSYIFVGGIFFFFFFLEGGYLSIYHIF